MDEITSVKKVKKATVKLESLLFTIILFGMANIRVNQAKKILFLRGKVWKWEYIFGVREFLQKRIQNKIINKEMTRSSRSSKHSTNKSIS